MKEGKERFDRECEQLISVKKQSRLANKKTPKLQGNF